jgi:hypothetical protein
MIQHQKIVQGQMGSAMACGDEMSLCTMQAKRESNLIEKANDSWGSPVQQGTESSLVAAPTGGWFPRLLSQCDHDQRT